MEKKKQIVIGLAGNPNAGKTSLFNKLTGLRAHVANYPGVTVEQKWGELTHKGRTIKVVDLPGTYSLNSYSLDESVARDFLINERPDLVINVVDTTNLERNLYLTLQFLELGLPTVLAMNMMDISTASGVIIDMEKLAIGLGGVPAMPIVAKSGQGVEDLLDKAVAVADSAQGDWAPLKITYDQDITEAINSLESKVKASTLPVQKMPSRWLTIKYLEGDPAVSKIFDQEAPEIAKEAAEIRQKLAAHLLATLDDEIEGVMVGCRYGFLTSLGRTTITRTRKDTRKISDAIDQVLLNRFLSPIFFLLSIYLLYQFTFWASEPISNLIGAGLEWMTGIAITTLPDGLAKDLLVEGILGGVGGIFSFVPLIAFMFIGIAVLEDSGYMARVAFILDRIFRAFGLHGNSVVALIVGGGIAGGCAIPGVMATRTLRDDKERITTILVTPFMTCGAKLPVFLMLVGAFFNKNIQSEIMLGLTLFAWAIALVSAKLLRLIVLPGAPSPFVLELPPYRMPTLYGVLIHSLERTWLYIKKAGTVIVGITILVWVVMTFPELPENKAAEFKAKVEVATSELAQAQASQASSQIITELTAAKAHAQYADSTADLRYSIAGRAGLALEPVSLLIGFDWRTNIALVAGFAAKEVVLTSLGTAYSIDEYGNDLVPQSVAESALTSESTLEAEPALDDEQKYSQSLGNRLANDPSWSPLVAICLMIFVMIYAPCFVTIAVIYREIGVRWATFSLVGSTVYAYVICLIIYQGGKFLGIGI